MGKKSLLKGDITDFVTLKVRADLQKKQQRYPNDREIARDLSIVDGELAKATVAIAPAGKAAGIDRVMQKANDPELDDNALRRESKGVKTTCTNSII